MGYQVLSAGGVPPQLTLNQVLVNTPHGRTFGVIFVWSSEDERTGRRWLKKVEALGTVIMNMVAMASIPDWIRGTARFTPTGFHGEGRTRNIRQMTDEVMDVIARSFEKMPADPVSPPGSHIRYGVVREKSAPFPYDHNISSRSLRHSLIFSMGRSY
jgi:hypothetical protein